MLESANKALRTLLLLALVALLAWWTLFLRTRLTGHEQDLETKNEEIAALADELAERDEAIEGLEGELTAREERIVALDGKVAEQVEALALQEEAIVERELDNAAKAQQIH
ncbi:MAG: hypothetical protein P1V81_15590, partial [Planctomycetota bacterium]|nr:hypothetical protein [Planctomycetota bacterium]